MNIVVDMNLPPSWCAFLKANGHSAVHWSSVGDPRAADIEILTWARNYQHIVMTHDLDFGAILAATGLESPSVIQSRAQDVTPEGIGGKVILSLSQFAPELEQGALLVISENHTRVRILPLGSQQP